MRTLASYSDPISRIKTKALRKLVETDTRIQAFTIEPDGVFLYTDSSKWDNGDGCGTWREDSETAVVKDFLATVRKAD